jgi:hypothetical protein
MDTSFSYRLRVHACDQCGGPVEGAVQGGTFACRYCRAQNHLGMRDEGMAIAPRPPIPEHERIARLRMQDGKPLLPPASLAQLMPGGRLEEWKVQEAVSVWNGTRRELRASPGNYEAAERLTFLTMVLSQHFHTKNERMQQRSLLESTLEVVSLPRHRQIMRGFLCRAAVRAGDLEGAEAWLAPCDTSSDDLETDSAYRFSRAFLDTARGDFQRVLQVLGNGPHDVPIEDASDDVCAVFRANAWEKLGRVDEAVSLLGARLQAGGGSGRATVQRVVQLYSDWHLCAQSYPHAAAGHAQVAGQVAAQRASGGVHVVFIPLGVLMFLGGLVTVAVMIAGMIEIIDLEAGAYAGIGITGATLVGMGLLFGLIGLAMKKGAQRAAWLRMHGLSATGQVQAVQTTGLSINDVPQVEFTLLVQLPGRPPYQARAKALMSGGLGGMQPGGSVPLRVHPQNPNELIIEMD